MLDALKFCAGSVASKDFIPALTHFVIENGHVRGFNGILGLSSPIPFDISCKPKATTLIKAIAACTGTVQLAMTPAGRLSVKSKGFKAFIDCVDGETPHAVPEGQIINFDGQLLLDGLKAVAPFIGTDAARAWANGVLIEKQSLFATNNVTLVQYWLGIDFPSVVNIPRDAVKEMLRINEPPIFAQITEGSISFHYLGDRWLRTQLYDSSNWPDISKVLDKPSTQSLVDKSIFDALEYLKPFTDKQGSILFLDGKLTTHTHDNEGAEFEVESVNVEGKYNIDMLNLLKGSAKTIDWTTYPKPCLFMGERLRGAIIGLRQ